MEVMDDLVRIGCTLPTLTLESLDSRIKET